MSNKEQRESAAGYHYYETFTQCPRKGYLRYILGLKPQYTSQHLIFGGAMHEAIGWYYTNRNGLPPNELIDGAQQKLHDEIVAQREKYEKEEQFEENLEKGEVMLNTWHNTWYQHDRENYELVEVEKQYNVYVGPNEEFIFTARPDRIMRDPLNGRYYVFDVKTTGWSVPGTYASVDCQDQMTSYLWILQRSHPDWVIAGAVPDIIYKRKSVVKAERPGLIYRSKDAIIQFEMGLYGKILEVSQKYQSLDDFPAEVLFPRNGAQCAKFGCEYNLICRTHIRDDLPLGFERDEWTDEMEVLRNFNGVNALYKEFTNGT